MPTSSIDDLLMGAKTSTHPETPENQYQEGPEEVQELDSDTEEASEESYQEETVEQEEDASQENDSEPTDIKKREYDEYGNEKEPENKEIRERLKKQARKYETEIESLRAQLSQQGASPQVQKAAEDFEYDPEGSGDWQQQLASFVKQTVNSMSREKVEHEQRQQEAQSQKEFEDKFRQGINKLDDFREVIRGLDFPITDYMTIATRALSDPAAFLYAAAKRNPKELERISKIRDPYAQITEMGRLEERMRRNKPMTKAPRPLSRSNDDGGMPAPKNNKEPTIEDLIAKSDQKKLARVKGRAPARR